MIGRKINNYEVVSLLGEGGMGSVYVAEHPILGRRVAIKVLRREFAEDKTLVARFMNEARAASAIRQPNIIEILDVGMLPEGVPYLMMQLLEGESLASRLFRDKRLSLEDALAYATQAATALAAAHAKQIVHRDLKPDNLFLVPEEGVPGGQRVVVLDFGIAKLRGDLSSGSVKTHTGSVMGTPPYMSPEQCRGLVEDIDDRTDIYALGIILHEMLTGAPPFVSAGFGDLIIMHITQPPVPLRKIIATIPPHVEAVVLRALEKKREDRFSSMAELKSALLGGTLRLTGDKSKAPPQVTGAAAEVERSRMLERAVVNPKTISTLTVSTGEMLAVDPRALATVPLRRSGRTVATVVGGVVLGLGVVAAIVVGAGSRHSEQAVAPTTSALAPAPTPAAAPAAPSPPAAAPATAAPVAAPMAPAEIPPTPREVSPSAPVAPAPRDLDASRRAAVRPPKHKTVSRSSLPTSRAAEANATPPSHGPPSPPPAVAPPPAKPTPKVSVDKW